MRGKQTPEAARMQAITTSSEFKLLMGFLDEQVDGIKEEMIRSLGANVELKESEIGKLKELSLKRRHFSQLIDRLKTYIQNTLQE